MAQSTSVAGRMPHRSRMVVGQMAAEMVEEQADLDVVQEALEAFVRAARHFADVPHEKVGRATAMLARLGEAF